MENRKIIDISRKNNWVSVFKEQKLIEYKSLEMPKWKRVNLNGFNIPEIGKFSGKLINNENENILIEDIDNIYKYKDLKEYLLSYREYGFDDKFVTLSESMNNGGTLIRAGKGSINGKPIGIKYNFNKHNRTLVEYNLIIAEENSEINVVVDYNSEDESKAFHTGITKIIARDNSKVNIIKIQRLNKNSENIDINLAYIEGRAEVNWLSIEIGASITASSYSSNLMGSESASNMHSVYLGDDDRKLDLRYAMNHFGVGSSSNIESRGVLKDNSKKVFRGNLDFKRGARKAVGREEEYVILMDPTVKSDAIPVLFCEEDDVKGEHAASAGQIDGDKLFYLMSRGLDERQAKQLIVEAAFNPILNKIPYGDLRENISLEINRRLANE